jgi:hypothetical protein
MMMMTMMSLNMKDQVKITPNFKCPSNVRGELVFSVTVARWFYEKSG